MTNNITNNNATKKPVDLKAIQKAERFLSENFLMGTFYLFCGEIREKGIKEKWDHATRFNAVAAWARDVEMDNPFNEKPQGIERALTEWYERVYLPSKYVPRESNYQKKPYNKDGEQKKEGGYQKREYNKSQNAE